MMWMQTEGPPFAKGAAEPTKLSLEVAELKRDQTSALVKPAPETGLGRLEAELNSRPMA